MVNFVRHIYEVPIYISYISQVNVLITPLKTNIKYDHIRSLSSEICIPLIFIYLFITSIKQYVPSVKCKITEIYTQNMNL